MTTYLAVVLLTAHIATASGEYLICKNYDCVNHQMNDTVTKGVYHSDAWNVDRVVTSPINWAMTNVTFKNMTVEVAMQSKSVKIAIEDMHKKLDSYIGWKTEVAKNDQHLTMMRTFPMPTRFSAIGNDTLVTALYYLKNPAADPCDNTTTSPAYNETACKHHQESPRNSANQFPPGSTDTDIQTGAFDQGRVFFVRVFKTKKPMATWWQKIWNKKKSNPNFDNRFEINLDKLKKDVTESGKKYNAGRHFHASFSPTWASVYVDEVWLEEDKCRTPDCIEASSRIQGSLNPAVQPCDDFYQFSCGSLLPKWTKYDPLSALSGKNKLQVQSFLKGPDNVDFLPPVRSARNVFQACMDLDAIEARGIEHFKTWLSANLGEWPLISSDWDEDKFDITEAIIKAIRIHVMPLVMIFPDVDFQNSSNKVMYVAQLMASANGPPLESLLRDRNDTKIKAYEALHYSVAESLGFINNRTARQDVADAIDFEIKLAKIRVPDENRLNLNALYNPTTLEGLQKQYGNNDINYTRIIIDLLIAPEVAINDITDSERVINTDPSFLMKLKDILEQTNKKIIANYISWKVTQIYFTELTQVFRNHKATYDTSRAPSREFYCTSLTIELFKFALGKKFVDDNFTPEAKNVALDMIDGIQGVFNDWLPEVIWMDNTTKTAAVEKNKAIIKKIGYPQFMDNVTEFIYYYEKSNLNNFTNDTHFEAIVLAGKLRMIQLLRSLRQPVDRTEWKMSPSNAMAEYRRNINDITIPAGILQPPFFNNAYPKYLNYGSIGTIMGHEMFHGFDNTGRLFNEDGDTLKWWTDDSIAGFESQKQCIVDQADRYVMPSVNMTINGIQTQDENIADNGGVKYSFKAYRKWVESRGTEELKLDGLEYSQDQLFFIAFAQSWCHVVKDQALETYLLTQKHSPGQYRVIGTLRNSWEFSQAFNCPKTSRMNPENKCNLW